MEEEHHQTTLLSLGKERRERQDTAAKQNQVNAARSIDVVNGLRAATTAVVDERAKSQRLELELLEVTGMYTACEAALCALRQRYGDLRREHDSSVEAATQSVALHIASEIKEVTAEVDSGTEAETLAQHTELAAAAEMHASEIATAAEVHASELAAAQAEIARMQNSAADNALQLGKYKATWESARAILLADKEAAQQQIDELTRAWTASEATLGTVRQRHADLQTSSNERTLAGASESASSAEQNSEQIRKQMEDMRNSYATCEAALGMLRERHDTLQRKYEQQGIELSETRTREQDAVGAQHTAETAAISLPAALQEMTEQLQNTHTQLQNMQAPIMEEGTPPGMPVDAEHEHVVDKLASTTCSKAHSHEAVLAARTPQDSHALEQYRTENTQLRTLQEKAAEREAIHESQVAQLLRAVLRAAKLAEKLCEWRATFETLRRGEAEAAAVAVQQSARIEALEAALRSSQEETQTAVEEALRCDNALKAANEGWVAVEFAQATTVETLRAEHDATLSAQAVAMAAQKAQLSAVQVSHAVLEDKVAQALLAADTSAKNAAAFSGHRDQLQAELERVSGAASSCDTQLELQDEAEKLRAALSVVEAKSAIAEGRARRAE